MARCDTSQDGNQNTRTDGFGVGNRKPVFNLIVFEAVFQGHHQVKAGEGPPGKGLPGGE